MCLLCKRSTFAVAVECPVGRVGQGTGTAGTQVLPLCRRLQHLRAVAGGGGTGDEVGDQFSGQASALESERGEERGGTVSGSVNFWVTR